MLKFPPLTHHGEHVQSFGVTRRHKVRGGNKCFANVSQGRIRTSGGSLRTWVFRPTSITTNYTACTPKSQVTSITSGCTAYNVNGT